MIRDSRKRPPTSSVFYMNPPQHAVFCVRREDRDSSTRPAVLPLSTGSPWNSVVTYAALDVKAGKVQGMTAARHTSQGFVAFLERLAAVPLGRQIHVRLDNLTAHKTKGVELFLAAHSKVRFHFKPTYSSWLNQVELWFAKTQRDVISRGVFTSGADLGKKLRKIAGTAY